LNRKIRLKTEANALVQHKHTRRNKKLNNIQKEVETKLTKGLMDLIVLQLLRSEPMHGYQIITRIRRAFGVYLGPSTIYPMLTGLEKKGYVDSAWNTETERPRKVYKLTSDGNSMLKFSESTLNLICSTLAKAAPVPSVEMRVTIAPR